MQWLGFRADWIILWLLLKYVVLQAQIMIRVIKPRAAACEMMGGGMGKELCPPVSPRRSWMGLYGGLHLPLKKRVLPTGGAQAPSLASSAATIPCFSVKIKHESLV